MGIADYLQGIKINQYGATGPSSIVSPYNTSSITTTSGDTGVYDNSSGTSVDDAQDGDFDIYEPNPVDPVFAEFDPTYYEAGISYLDQQTNNAINYAEEQYGIAAGYQEPFYNDATAYTTLSDNTLNGVYDLNNDANAFVFDMTDPEYQQLLAGGVDAIDKGASSQGLLNSGSRQKDIVDYGIDTTNQYADDVLDRREQVSSNNFDNLNTVAGYEQRAANQLSGIYTGLGKIGSNAYVRAGTTGANLYGRAGNQENQMSIRNAQFANSANQNNVSNFLKYQGQLIGLANNGQGGQLGTLVGQIIGGLSHGLFR